jgi:uncharacterized protein (DUF983 family)
MKKLDSCFECGFKYERKSAPRCPRCGEEKIFIPSLHDPNYDIAKDLSAHFRYRLYGIATVVTLWIFVLSITQ